MVTEKRCTKCGEVKPREAFANSRSQKDGLHIWCRPCHSAYSKNKRDLERLAMLDSLAPDTKFSEFGDVIHRARLGRQWTQEQVGKMVGVTGTQVRLWEKGAALPRQAALQSLCSELGIDVPLIAMRGPRGHIPLGVRECATCGKPFPVFKARVRHCSRTCSGAEQSGRQTGATNPAWRGGRTNTAGGYIQVKMPGHPRAYKNGYVLEHILVMEQVLNRPLEKHERIHHRDGNRANNDPANLELWKVKKKDPAGVRAADYHCPGCRCGELN